MASGAIGDYFVSDPVRELNEPQSNPGLGYKPPKREVTPDGDSGLGGEGTLDGTMRQHQGSFELTE
jgi:hypothetical protein